MSDETERDWLVSWMGLDVYRGQNTILAGIHLARLARDSRPMGNVHDVATADIDGDGQTDDEHDFFGACHNLGLKFRKRREMRRAS